MELLKVNKYIRHFFRGFFHYKFKRYIVSPVLRFIFRFNFAFRLYMKYYKLLDLNEQKDFWVVRIGFLRKRNFSLFLNIDPFLENHPNICANLHSIPLAKESCQKITIKKFLFYVPENKINRVIRNWREKLILGGKLQVHLRNIKYQEMQDILNKILTNFNFYIENIDYSDIKIDGTVNLTAIKEKPKIEIPPNLNVSKAKDIVSIILENHADILKKQNLLLIGHQYSEIESMLSNSTNLNPNIIFRENLGIQNDFVSDLFDGAIIVNFLEYHNYSEYGKFFDEIRRILKPDSPILIIVPEKMNYKHRFTAHIFDKGNIMQIFDKFNFTIDWVNLNTNFRLIQALIKNKFENPIEKNQIKYALLGNYNLRYTHLNNAFWDGQVRAFEKLGFSLQVLDVKDHSLKYLIQKIKSFDPDYLWIAGKVAIDLLKTYADFFRNSKIKVVYWFWDARVPIKFNFKDVINYMFISGKGEVPIYKEAYNIEHVYFMPSPVVPQTLHRNARIKEIYDIGFTGLLDESIYHRERTKIIKFLKEHFNVKVVNNIFNNVPEFYSQCKIVFGGTPDYKDVELLSSDRLYIALSCGCCYLTNYFKGLELLGENGKHFLWYKDCEDLLQTVKKYLSNSQLRESIKKNAEELAKTKHHYLERIKNMLDIVHEKTEEFYGFLN